MSTKRLGMALAVLAAAASLEACHSAGEIGPTGTGGPGSGLSGGNDSGGQSGTGAGGVGSGSVGAGSGGTGGVVSTMSDVPLIPARVRRLANAEYDASVQALLGTSQTLAAK